MKPFVITIARRYGSGGKTVGRMLAKELNIPFYDREIIAMASEDSGVNEVLFSDERLRPDLRSRLRRCWDTVRRPRARPGTGSCLNTRPQ